MARIVVSAFVSDRHLALALAVGAALVVNGIWWGWVEEWNPDEMALRSLLAPGRGFLEPGEFLKPPFHTYLNFFLSVLPIKIVERLTEVATGRAQDFAPIILYWSRLIQLALFLGIVWLSYRIVARFSTAVSARSVAFITATSAGFILQAHFLTADIPVTFWMLASFACAQSILFSGRWRDYLTAGLVAGVATATKYNGLAVGLAIPIFHWFAHRATPLPRLALDPRLMAGVAMVVVGFVLANPYSVLDFQRFSTDFMYNYVTTPIYGGGDTTASGYGTFLMRIPEILGWPMALATLAGVAFIVVSLRRASVTERANVIAALGVVALYFWKFGAPPRVEVRFVLPIVPFLLVATAPSWSAFVRRYEHVAVGVVAALLVYNVLASYSVGRRFAEDPRMGAQSWVAAHVPRGSRMESSQYTPHWNLYQGTRVTDIRIPSVSGRTRLFATMFASDSWEMRRTRQSNPDDAVGWYQPATLAERRPDFIALDSIYIDRFLEGETAQLYPEMRTFLKTLLAGQLGYHVVYDQSSRGSPAWLYPREMVFVDNHVVILKRDVSRDADGISE